MSVLNPSRPGQGLLRRRDFLALSSVAVGAALAPGLATAQRAFAASEPLSVGYLEGSDRLDNVFQLPWRDVPPIDREPQLVVPAKSLIAGDSAMAFSLVDIKIHGLYPAMPPARLATLAAAYLTIFHHVPWLGFEKPLPHYPWGANFGTRPNCGAPNRFQVPTREDGSLAMTLDIIPNQGKKGAVPRRAVADFTVDSWAERPKLQRGIYFLGFESSTFAREQEIPADPDQVRWDLCSLVMSVEHVEKGAI